MQAKNVLYAAVGAPVVAARMVNDAVGDLRTRISKETSDYTKVVGKALDQWASEGEKVVTRVTDTKAVEELTARVDLDQAKEQVGKLRTQLEDMLATWRSSFRPEKSETTMEPMSSPTAPAKPAAKRPAAKKTAAKKPAARKPAAKKTAARKPAAKKPAAKTSAAKTTKSTAAKTSSAKAPAAKTAKVS
ncbi:MAG: hypothetical protein OEM39_10160 [Acidimicrobiia bacterium]|nr:hypothetical protein [Acidimicrobiia bacterium]MDH3463033.1 hypothetical protein [Acidimicrobiia bacterium]